MMSKRGRELGQYGRKFERGGRRRRGQWIDILVALCYPEGGAQCTVESEQIEAVTPEKSSRGQTLGTQPQELR